jgi:ribonucleoside-diphosphate reductase alpha chain
MWSNGSMVTSCADSVAKSLENFLELDQNALANIEELNKNTSKSTHQNIKGSIATCPDCGSAIEHSEGCLICNSCGWSKC